MCVSPVTSALLALFLVVGGLSGEALGQTSPFRAGLGGGWSVGAGRLDLFGPVRAGGASLAPKWSDGPLGTLQLGMTVFGPIGLEASLAGAPLLTADATGSGTALHALLDVTLDLVRGPVVVVAAVGGGVSSLVAGNMGRDTDMALNAALGLRYRFGRSPVGLRVDAHALATDSVSPDATLAVAGLLCAGVYFTWGLGESGRSEALPGPEPGPGPAPDSAQESPTPTEPANVQGAACAPGDGDCADLDADGIPDDDDRCPSSAGLAAFRGCPDVDGDGIPDTRDGCPTIAGIERFQGCPDQDGDGLADGDDRCPQQRGEKDSDGCPGPTPQVLELVNRPLKGVAFLQGKATLLAEALPMLNRVARVLRIHEHLHVEVQAHTHSQYPIAKAKALTARRATTIVGELVSLGIDPRRLRGRGMGAMQPIASNRTRRGRALNERVEIHVVTP